MVLIVPRDRVRRQRIAGRILGHLAPISGASIISNQNFPNKISALTVW
jgi:hypothetical protein